MIQDPGHIILPRLQALASHPQLIHQLAWEDQDQSNEMSSCLALTAAQMHGTPESKGPSTGIPYHLADRMNSCENSQWTINESYARF